MNGEAVRKAAEFRSRLSFAPLLKKWREIISGANENAGFFVELIHQFSNAGKLSHPIDDYRLLQKHKELVDRAIASLFPLTLSDDEANAITPPFSNKVVYASQAFKTLLMDDNGAMLPFDPQVAANIAAARIVLAYKIILKKFYGIDLVGGDAFICAYPDA